MTAHRHSEAPAHRLVPALLTGSLVLGTAAALGHHFYYSFLDAKIVESQTQQEWYIRIGTGLAFLARALLSASVGFTYTQLLWRTLRTRPITVNGVDALFGLVSNIWNFRVWEIWRFGPVLIIVAMVIWALPLVAVVTPATLTVQLSAHMNETIVDLAIPNVVYDSVSKFAYWQQQGRTLQGPSSRIARLLTAVTSYGSVLPISNPQGYPNSSYTLDFYGPSLSCRQPENSTFLEQVSNLTAVDQGGSAWSYVAFVPAQAGSFDETPAEEGIERAAIDGLNQTLQRETSPDTVDQNSAFDHARLYVVVPPWPLQSLSSAWSVAANTTIECGLYNTSYTANFTFNNGDHSIAWNKTQLNGVNIASATGPSSDGTVNSTQGTAYVSMLMALGDLLVGEIMSSHYGVVTTFETLVLNTVLSETKELQLLQAVTGTSEPLTIANMSMADALEETFTNATLSLFSDAYFLQNQTAASQSPPTRVTVRSPQNEYHYEPRNIYIAYGSAVLLTSALAALGLATIHAASASYGSSFSTIVRTTRNADLDRLVSPAASTGAEPSPRELARARLRLLRRRRRTTAGGAEEEEEEEERVSQQVWTSFEVVSSGPGGRAASKSSGSSSSSTAAAAGGAKTGFVEPRARRISYDSLLQNENGGDVERPLHQGSSRPPSRGEERNP